MPINKKTKQLLIEYAEKYETKDFIKNDPISFVHQAYGEKNQETIGFIASWFSYGNRKQFMPKINKILEYAEGEVYNWVKLGYYKNNIHSNNDCFYRLYSNKAVFDNLQVLQQLLIEHDSLKKFIAENSTDTLSAIKSLCHYYNKNNNLGIIPQSTTSACKRLCMYLRWMVRENSPVDLGLWKTIIPINSLIMPLDTHVLNMAQQIGLLQSKNSSMKIAIELTEKLKEIFPDDPLKGDFALYGYSISQNMREFGIVSNDRT